MVLSKWWSKVPAGWKAEFVSAWHTFVAAFLAEMVLEFHSLSTSGVTWGIVYAILFAAFRSAVKAVFMWAYSQVKPAPTV